MNEELEQKLTDRFEAISAKAECDNEVRDALLKAYLAGGEYGYQYALQQPQWIPVDERLPEKGKDVLVWSSGSDVPMAGYYWHWNWQRKQHMFYVYNDRNMWGNITHWMPIVPPRKEDKQ